VSNVGFYTKVLSNTKAMYEELQLLRARVKDLDIENKELKSKLYKNK
tara:strand:+ start:363 stop:503 length:141 start_codon:yes stop_codon:yes gene_type:complete